MTEGGKWGQVYLDLDLENCRFKQGKYIVTKGKTNPDSRWSLRCRNSPCPGKAIILQARLEAVLDQNGKEIALAEIDEQTRKLLETTNKQVISCLKHLLLKVAGTPPVESAVCPDGTSDSDRQEDNSLAPVIPINKARS